MNISIHAPCTGSDETSSDVFTGTTNFNPRSLHGERRPHSISLVTAHNFNPRSLHGERHAVYMPKKGLKGISIHAPCTGSDKWRGITMNNEVIFQSTLPARGATPRTTALVSLLRHFNPRSLHGERRCKPVSAESCALYFNPRSLHGERPKVVGGHAERFGISIHAPCTGSDLCRKVACPQALIISIHAPCTGSDRHPFSCRRYIVISIHAPCTGSDP